MPNEDIEIRITKNGEIFVKVNGVGEERVRNYRTFLEEVIGPILSEERIDAPDWEKPAELVDEKKKQQELEH